MKDHDDKDGDGQDDNGDGGENQRITRKKMCCSEEVVKITKLKIHSHGIERGLKTRTWTRKGVLRILEKGVPEKVSKIQTRTVFLGNPLKNKKADAVLEAFQQLVVQINQKPGLEEFILTQVKR
eukprot:TRINITY_DN80015_c0_g1_i1.p1 TRINITY_DN80015_c0_g1~~TRINITY_DN80015_c0_g1_i1.p1  ORF type:complete len:124 (-),score=27.62 TRINITY_DN80015_c0_g1_i1:43-414(-)